MDARRTVRGGLERGINKPTRSVLVLPGVDVEVAVDLFE